MSGLKSFHWVELKITRKCDIVEFAFSSWRRKGVNDTREPQERMCRCNEGYVDYGMGDSRCPECGAPIEDLLSTEDIDYELAIADAEADGLSLEEFDEDDFNGLRFAA
jgi:hypothetical protein